jgi:hypothetical protein
VLIESFFADVDGISVSDYHLLILPQTAAHKESWMGACEIIMSFRKLLAANRRVSDVTH